MQWDILDASGGGKKTRKGGGGGGGGKVTYVSTYTTLQFN